MTTLYTQAKALFSGPPDKGIGAAQSNVDEYVNATKPAPAADVPKSDTNVRKKGTAPYGSKPGEKRIDTKEMTKPLGSYKKGGKVKKTGTYKLHKGERVMNVKQTKKIAAKGGMKALFGK